MQTATMKQARKAHRAARIQGERRSFRQWARATYVAIGTAGKLQDIVRKRGAVL